MRLPIVSLLTINTFSAPNRATYKLRDDYLRIRSSWRGLLQESTRRGSE